MDHKEYLNKQLEYLKILLDLLKNGREVTGDADEVYFTAADLGFTSLRKNLNITNPGGVMLIFKAEKV